MCAYVFLFLICSLTLDTKEHIFSQFYDQFIFYQAGCDAELYFFFLPSSVSWITFS